jgi:hypothetical protein
LFALPARKSSAVERPALERALREVRHGRFERSLSGLMALGAGVTAAEVYLEHDRASFGNRWMWAPVLLGPAGVAAGVGGVASPRLAHTTLPAVSLLLVANGLQGTYFHVRGVAQRPGGWRNWRYHLEMGPPLFAPLLGAMVGGMGLLAALLRRET